jgi:predicted alpha/beta-fold hydrolase
VPSEIKRAVAFSVPCDLESSAHHLARPAATLYMIRFLRSLKQKVRAKMKLFPGEINDDDFDRIRTFVEFDDRYTAPIHGFKDAHDYFTRCSSRQFLQNIRIPALLVNAQNDPFLTNASFPYEEARQSEQFYFEAPASGGHTGFVTFGAGGEYWSESRACAFLESSPPLP